MRVPESLPRWLKCVKWSNRDDVLVVEERVMQSGVSFSMDFV